MARRRRRVAIGVAYLVVMARSAGEVQSNLWKSCRRRLCDHCVSSAVYKFPTEPVA